MLATWFECETDGMAEASAPHQTIPSLWGADDSCRFDHRRLLWLVILICRKQADLLDDFKACIVGGSAKYGVLPVKRCLSAQTDEELTTC